MFESFKTYMRRLYSACCPLKKYFWRIWYIFAGITIFFSLMITVARFFTPLLHDYQNEILTVAAEKIGYPISVRQLEASWLGFHPVIKLVDVDMYKPQTQQKILHINRIYLAVSVFKSAFSQQLMTSQIYLSGSRITLFIKKTGEIYLGGPDGLLLRDPNQPKKKFALEFLLRQNLINLKHLRVQWQQENQLRHGIFVDEFTLANDLKNHRAVGNIHLDNENTPKISFFVNFFGTANTIEHWRFHAFFEANNINLKQLTGYLPFAPTWTLGGQASGKLWVNWENGLRRIQTKIQWQNPELRDTQSKYIAQLQSLTGIFSWLRPDESSWQIAGKDVTVQQTITTSPPFDFLIKKNTKTNSPLQSDWQIYTNYFDFKSSLPFVLNWPTLNPTLKTQLQTLQPNGQIQYINLLMHWNNQRLTRYDLNTLFNNVSLHPYLSFPGIKNLTGRVTANEKGGQGDLNAENSVIYFPNVFAGPQILRKFNTHFTWKKHHNVWKATALPIYFTTPEGESLLHLALTIPTDHSSPKISLIGTAQATSIRNVARYLPISIMPAGLVQWLKHAIVSGEEGNANIVWHGELAHFPYRQHEGRFQILAHLKNIKLNYYQNWPNLENVTGMLDFDGSSMQIIGESGRIFSSKLSQIIATVDNFLAPEILLHINGKVQGNAADGLRFILASPLATTLGKGLNDLMLNGDMKLNLALTIPFHSTTPMTVHGQTQLNNNSMKVKSWNLTFQKLTTVLDFTANTLNTLQDGHAEFFQHPVSFTIKTENSSSGFAQVITNFVGTLDTSQLQGIIPENWREKFSGTAPLQAQLTIPLSTKKANQTLTLTSSLQGIAIYLPSPLAKNAHDTENLHLKFDIISANQSIMQIIYGSHLSSVLQFNKVGDVFKLFSGEIALGRKTAIAQTQPGILLSGTLAEFNWTTWKNFLQAKSKQTSAEASSVSHWQSLINRLDLEIPTLTLNRLTLSDLHIVAKKIAQGWQATVISPLAQGSVLIPQNYPDGTVIMNLRRLTLPNNLTTGKSSTPAPFQPNDLPALMLKSDNTHFGNLDLGHLQLSMQPTTQGININRFSAQTANYEVLLQGNWIGGKTNTSTLKGQVTSSDLKSTLRDWNFHSSIDDEDMTLDFLVAWRGIPWTPDLASLRGTMFLKMGPGRINGLERGANLSMVLGRLLNLFSLDSLQRRLRLDFTDVTKKGYSFEKMSGTFNLAQGSATTKDAQFKSTIADIAFNGRIGYTTRDYDLNIRISPELTSSLPLVATIAGGPVAGIAALAAQKILNPKIKKVIAYHYHISGTWDNPQIKPK